MIWFSPSTILPTTLKVYIFIIALFFFCDSQEPETIQHLLMVEWINKSRRRHTVALYSADGFWFQDISSKAALGTLHIPDISCSAYYTGGGLSLKLLPRS